MTLPYFSVNSYLEHRYRKAPLLVGLLVCIVGFFSKVLSLLVITVTQYGSVLELIHGIKGAVTNGLVSRELLKQLIFSLFLDINKS